MALHPCFVLAPWPCRTTSLSPNSPCTLAFGLFLRSDVACLPLLSLPMQSPAFKAWHLLEAPFSGLHQKPRRLPPLHFLSILFILCTAW